MLLAAAWADDTWVEPLVAEVSTAGSATEARARLARARAAVGADAGERVATADLVLRVLKHVDPAMPSRPSDCLSRSEAQQRAAAHNLALREWVAHAQR
jgi:hypothetical protein